MRRGRNLMAVGFYTVLAGVAILWNGGAGRPLLALLFDAQRITRQGLLWGLTTGMSLALVVVVASRISTERFDWGRELYTFFARALGDVTWADALLLATASSIGEELLFRGIMLPRWGLWLSSLLFMLLHPAPARRLWPWTASAGVLGLAFGLITQRSANLGGAVLGHFVVNLLNLRHVSKFIPLAEAIEEAEAELEALARGDQSSDDEGDDEDFDGDDAGADPPGAEDAGADDSGDERSSSTGEGDTGAR